MICCGDIIYQYELNILMVVKVVDVSTDMLEIEWFSVEFGYTHATSVSKEDVEKTSSILSVSFYEDLYELL